MVKKVLFVFIFGETMYFTRVCDCIENLLQLMNETGLFNRPLTYSKRLFQMFFFEKQQINEK